MVIRSIGLNSLIIVVAVFVCAGLIVERITDKLLKEKVELFVDTTFFFFLHTKEI